MAVVSDRVARAFNSSGATQAAALDISKGLERVWHAGLFHKVKDTVKAYFYYRNYVVLDYDFE